MIKSHRCKYRVLLGIAAVLMMSPAVSMMASNMGFTINKALATNYVAALFPKGDNWVALPYSNPWQKAKDLCTARFANSGSVSILKLEPSTGTWTTFFCSDAANSPSNFVLMNVPRGILIHNTASTPASITLVGNHDNTKALPTIYGGYVVSLAPRGENWISLPYHATWGSAEDVCTGLGLQGTVIRLDAASGSYESHPCGDTTISNFPLVPGQAILIHKTSAGNIVAFIPPHR